MTELLYQTDAYLREFDARVVAVEGGAVALDRTAFYATSGGQPHDIGTLAAGGRSWQVTEVRRQGEHAWHTLAGEGLPAVGDTVHGGVVDWDSALPAGHPHRAAPALRRDLARLQGGCNGREHGHRRGPARL